jgi:hypothetical protein
MRRSRRSVLLLLVVASLGVCGVAQANSMSPFVLFWPGILHTSLVYSLPATILVAIIERDYFRRTDDRRGSLILSLRANFLSTLVGILLVPASVVAIYSPICLLLPFAAFAISCCVEIGYLRAFIDRAIPASPLVFANAVSTAVLAFVPSIAEVSGELRPEWGWWMWDRWNSLFMATSFASAAVLVGAWIVPYRRRVQDSSPDAERSGASEAESVCPDPSEPQLASSK